MTQISGSFAYRLPGEDLVHSGAGPVEEGIIRGGFSVSPFDNRIVRPLTILAEKVCLSRPVLSPRPSESSSSAIASKPFSAFSAPLPSRDYVAAIEQIQTVLKAADGGKMVLARCIESSSPIDIAEAFDRLCLAYPQAFVFRFHIPGYGEWLGASPELLLACRKGGLETMALAGTRPAGSVGSWDVKNLEEQQMVVDYIMDIFRHNGLNPEAAPLFTRHAGPVEHICTPIRASLREEAFISDSVFSVEAFLRELSPTPALCGSQKEEAMEMLGRLEKEPRGMYGGWCGPVEADGDFSLYVNLRSGCLLPNGHLRLYTGSGITLLSSAHAEWEETARKAATLLDCL